MNNRTNASDILKTAQILIQENPECFRNVPRETILKITDNCAKPDNIISEIIEIIVNLHPSETVVNEFATCFTQIIYMNESCFEHISKEESDCLVAWFQKVYEENTDAEIPVLMAISYFLKICPKHGKHFCEKVLHLISTVFTRLETASKEPLQTCQYMLPIVQSADAVVTCLEVTDLTDSQIKFCTKISTSLIQILQSKTSVHSVEYTFFVLYSLVLLQKIAVLCTEYKTDQSDKLLGLAKAYMFYNEENYKDFVPPLIQSSQRMIYKSLEEVNSLDSSAEYKSCKGKVPKLHKPRITITNKCSTRQLDLQENQANVKLENPISDSDISEQDIKDVSYLEERHHFVKIRLAALKLLETIAQDKRILYSYWHIIFPHDIKNTSNARNDLFYVSQKDPSTKCRHTSLLIGTQLILSSKGFLSQAKYISNEVTCAFQPYSQNLGLQILNIYEVLSSILVTECSMSVIIQTLKCLAALVQATPFHQIECKFVKPLLKTVQELVSHSDITAQLAALTVFEFLVVIPNLPLEISEAMGFPKTTEKKCDRKGAYLATTSNSVKIPTDEFWLLKSILRNLSCSGSNVDGDVKIPALVRMKSLQMLSAMAVHFKAFLFDNLDQVAISLTQSFYDHQSDIRLYASRLLDNCAYHMGLFLLDNDSNDCVGNCMRFWIQMLPIVMEHIQNEQNIPTLKVCLCDGLSNIGVVVFEHLSSGLQINLLSFLSGISSEITEETTVRAAAARALSVFTLFPLLRGNLVFMENTAESILRLINDLNLIVRIKSSWALGNVSDALLSTTSTNLEERISDTLLFRMINVATTACNDNDKVRCNAVRTVGNLLYLLSDTHFHSVTNRMVVNDAIKKLTECVRTAGNAKVKWNSCYAIGNFMRNDSLFLATDKYEDLDWLLPLYAALRYVIGHHSNYKVRINATSAILCINSRSHFGNDFENFWSITLEAIEQSYNLHNFYEYNHRDQLQEKLCLVMCHLIRLAKPDDFIVLKRSLFEKVEIVRNTWTRVVSRMIPEKCATMFVCPILLQELLKQNLDLNVEQKRAIEFIIQTTTISQ